MDIEKIKYFDDHKIVLFFNNQQVRLKGFIAIHNNNLGPGIGGTRFLKYKNEEEALSDVLRLSKTMTYKCAISGIKYGGAKAVLIADSKVKNKKYLEAYAEIINVLSGNFYTGEDVGMFQKDIEILRKKSNYIVGSAKKSGSPAYWAALSVYKAIKASSEFLFKNNSLKNKIFAIKGVGKLGSHLIDFIIKEKPETIFISDIDKSRINLIKRKYKNIQIIDTNKIHNKKVDFYCPCALGGEFNEKIVKELNCKVICGGANNQLENEEVGKLIFKKGIIYVPDYLANAGGLINVSDELEKGGYSPQRVYKKIELVYKRTLFILNQSIKYNKPTNLIANELAEKIFNNKK